MIARDRNQNFHEQKTQWIQLLESRRVGIVLSVITLGLLGIAWLLGDWQDFIEQWQSIPFVHLITLDFCLMTLFFPLTPLLDDDMARRGGKDSPVFWTVALLPLFGPLAYLCFRPPLTNQFLQATPSEIVPKPKHSVPS